MSVVQFKRKKLNSNKSLTALLNTKTLWTLSMNHLFCSKTMEPSQFKPALSSTLFLLVKKSSISINSPNMKCSSTTITSACNQEDGQLVGKVSKATQSGKETIKR